MNVTVFLGSTLGNDRIYTEEVVKIGKWIAKNGHTLVFGGSREGLMEKLAVTVMQQGASAIGVQTKYLNKKYGAVENLTTLELVDKMAERITRMIELGDMFIIFPGGVGTLEEAAQVLSRNKLGIIGLKHIAFYNLNGFYDGFKKYLIGMDKMGFGDEKSIKVTHFIKSIQEVEDIANIVLQDIDNKKQFA